MTALDRYVRLEAAGRWREAADAPWREVLVSFGSASLVISTFDEAPLTHWSLAAVERLSLDGGTARYAADGAGHEVLEVHDPDMIEAIAEVSRMARHRGAPRQRGRRRRAVAAGLGAAALAALAWLALGPGPDMLRARALDLIPPEQEARIAARVMRQLGTRPCDAEPGRAALARLSARAVPGTRVAVMPWTAPEISVLPGGGLLLARGVVEDAAAPEAVAGALVLGHVMAPRASALADWVGGMGPAALAGFLATGRIGPPQIARIAAHLRDPMPPPEPAEITAAAETMQARGIDPAPFLAAHGRAPGPAAGARVPPPSPVLPRDRDWVALQNICEG